MTGPMGNPRQTAGFAISDILELDRHTNVGIDPPPNDSALYSHPPHDISGYVPISRHWAPPPDGKISQNANIFISTPKKKINIILTITSSNSKKRVYKNIYQTILYSGRYCKHIQTTVAAINVVF